jgi:hypothetical protein
LPTGPELAEFVPATVTLFAPFTREAGSTLTLTPVGLAAVTCPLMATSWPADDVADGARVVVVVAGLAVVAGAEVAGGDVASGDVAGADLPGADLPVTDVLPADLPGADVVAVVAGFPPPPAAGLVFPPAWPDLVWPVPV